MEKAASPEDFHARINRDTLTVAVFTADWCPDCRFIDPFMPEIEAAYRDRITFVEVDRDDLFDICVDLGIMGIPSFVAFRSGREIVRFVSKLRKTRTEIERFLDRAVQVDEAMSGQR